MFVAGILKHIQEIETGQIVIVSKLDDRKFHYTSNLFDASREFLTIIKLTRLTNAAGSAFTLNNVRDYFLLDTIEYGLVELSLYGERIEALM